MKEDFWALKDVSFNVNAGESIGIIGKNGAGKSTLLKVLSKITPPSTGKIISRGRIASLLEVGTGFHPELTGRENIYMNGSILGMKRVEIQKNFDEIVDFSGVEKFLDTPLKHYSSGMQLRLAFAVAAFLENEILIIDEVLAVGDAEFQKKCMGKMDEIAHSGRTIIFVSHNMNAIKQLCTKVFYLKDGKLKSGGETNLILSEYAKNDTQNSYQNGYNAINAKIVKKISMFSNDFPTNSLVAGSDLKILVDFNSIDEIDFPVLGIIIRNEYDEAIIGVNNKHYKNTSLVDSSVKSGQIEFHLPFLPILNGRFSIDIHFGDGFKDLEVLKSCFHFNVSSAGILNASEVPNENLNKILIEKINWNYKHETN